MVPDVLSTAAAEHVTFADDPVTTRTRSDVLLRISMFCLSSRVHVVLCHDYAAPLVIDANAIHLSDQPADFL